MIRPEFSRPFRLSALPAAGEEITLEADAAERAALARRFGLIALDRLEARLQLRPDAAGGVAVSGRLSARLTQACVVTLEPVVQRIEESIAFRILPEGQHPSEDPQAEDEVESEGGMAELGEVVAQHLSLAIDPYPRAEGAVLPEAATDRSGSPFAALLRLRRE
ncbi:MAG: DUF177 domain-containing protein [Rhodovarius sp.]|nr:DUF177 domain-containing protein [Rhodovarius sp.]